MNQTIRMGSVGPDVAFWQHIIGTVDDGFFGKNTHADTVAWQAKRGLLADGIVGRATWAKAKELVPASPSYEGAILRAAVVEKFPAFTRKHEGRVPWMYRCVAERSEQPNGYVTIGEGALVDPVELALPLPFVHRDDGRPATQEEIRVEWMRIRLTPGLDTGGHTVADRYAKLRLLDGALDDLTRKRLRANALAVAARFPDWGSWCSDAQLFAMSMSWAIGAGFDKKFPKLAACLRAADFHGAIEHCTIKESNNKGVIGRNVANRALLANAEYVSKQGHDPNVLLYQVR